MITQCSDFVLSEDITLVGSKLVITIPTVDLTNGLSRLILLAQNVPEITDMSSPPKITIALEEDTDTTYNVIQTRTIGYEGVPCLLQADQLKLTRDKTQVATGQLIHVKYGTDVGHFNYVGPIPILRESVKT